MNVYSLPSKMKHTLLGCFLTFCSNMTGTVSLFLWWRRTRKRTFKYRVNPLHENKKWDDDGNFKRLNSIRLNNSLDITSGCSEEHTEETVSTHGGVEGEKDHKDEPDGKLCLVPQQRENNAVKCTPIHFCLISRTLWGRENGLDVIPLKREWERWRRKQVFSFIICSLFFFFSS